MGPCSIGLWGTNTIFIFGHPVFEPTDWTKRINEHFFNFCTPVFEPTDGQKGSLVQRSNRLSYDDTKMKYPKRRWSIPFANGHRHNENMPNEY
jgi:hypothetical protein